ncbi:MAG: hypothetical protein CYG59_05155, partial [Chloroflexi bacterium]
VTFDYEDRLDAFSEYRAGFEIRTMKRCRMITISTRTADGQEHPVRKYLFTYASDRHNGVSLLQQLDIIGFDDAKNDYQDNDPTDPHPKQLPPLTFSYTGFAPEMRKFEAVKGPALPTSTISASDTELVDLHGSGLPDILEMNGTVRYWRNLGNGHFDLPQLIRDAPPHALSEVGVQLLDANGDGRMDLMVTEGARAGYYPLSYKASWNPFQRFGQAPSFNLEDPEVRLIDLNGDGIIDALRSGTSFENFFNDPRNGWQKPRPEPRKALDQFPNVNFSDPRVKVADMTGDSMQDIVLIHNGNIAYWPNLGHGQWGRRVNMGNSPRLRDQGYTLGYDPRRILVGDVDGDGLADVVYVDDRKITLWINQSGNAWSDPIEIQRTPAVTDLDAIRLVDLLGTGI